VILRSQPAVSRRLFRCLGAHLLRSPLTVNPGQTHVTCWIATGGHTPPAENLGSPTSQFVLASRTSATRCRVLSHSPSRSFRSLVSVSQARRPSDAPHFNLHSHIYFQALSPAPRSEPEFPLLPARSSEIRAWENKKPRSPSVSRAEKSWSSLDALYLLTFVDLAGGYVPGLDRHLGRTHNRSTIHDVSRNAGLTSSVSSWLKCSCRFASNVGDVYHRAMVTVH